MLAIAMARSLAYRPGRFCTGPREVDGTDDCARQPNSVYKENVLRVRGCSRRHDTRTTKGGTTVVSSMGIVVLCTNEKVQTRLLPRPLPIMVGQGRP